MPISLGDFFTFKLDGLSSLWGGWEGLLKGTVLENDDGFWTHVEDEVNDAQVGQKTMFGGEYLVVGCGTE